MVLGSPRSAVAQAVGTRWGLTGDGGVTAEGAREEKALPCAPNGEGALTVSL